MHPRSSKGCQPMLGTVCVVAAVAVLVVRLSLGASTVLKGRRHRSPTPQKEEPPRRLSSSPQLDSTHTQTHAHTCLLCITPYASLRQRPLVPMGRLFSAIQSGSQAHPCLDTAKNRAFQDSAQNSAAAGHDPDLPRGGELAPSRGSRMRRDPSSSTAKHCAQPSHRGGDHSLGLGSYP